MSPTPSSYAEILALAEAYSEAVYFARADVFEDMCHPNFMMSLIEDGSATFWDKASYLERVRGRSAGEGAASYGIFAVDVAGDEIARVQLWVDVPSLDRYEDHLGFVKVEGGWKLLTKVFRTLANHEGG